jgi:hypothetical protein
MRGISAVVLLGFALSGASAAIHPPADSASKATLEHELARYHTLTDKACLTRVRVPLTRDGLLPDDAGCDAMASLAEQAIVPSRGGVRATRGVNVRTGPFARRA